MSSAPHVAVGRDRQGLTAEDRYLRNVDSTASELACQFLEDASDEDFEPADLLTVVAYWAKDAKVAADDLRQAVLKALNRFDATRAERNRIIRGLDPTRYAPAVRERE